MSSQQGIQLELVYEKKKKQIKWNMGKFFIQQICLLEKIQVLY